MLEILLIALKWSSLCYRNCSAMALCFLTEGCCFDFVEHFTSILDMARVLLPFLKWFIGGTSRKGPRILNFVKSPWCTTDVIGQVKLPILFISGLQDEMVLPMHMKMLYAKAAAHYRQCFFVEFQNGMHMDTWLSGGYEYWRTARQFIEQHASGKEDDEFSSRSNDSYSS